MVVAVLMVKVTFGGGSLEQPLEDIGGGALGAPGSLVVCCAWGWGRWVDGARDDIFRALLVRRAVRSWWSCWCRVRWGEVV